MKKKKKYPTISGLQSTQLAKKLNFTVRPPFVQVLHNGGNHWITVACMFPPYDTIKVYYSFNPLNPKCLFTGHRNNSILP